MKRHRIGCGALAPGIACLLGLGCASTDGDKKESATRKAASHYDMGVDYLKRGNTAMALRELQVALSVDEKLPRAHHATAEAYRLSGRTAEAEKHLKRALELDPTFQGARLSLAARYIQTERFEDAIRESRILVDDPTFPAPWRALTNAGWAEHRLGRNADARKSLVMALDMKPNYWPALLNLGILESQENRRAEAIERFSQVLAARPGPSAEAETNYRMAEIYVSLGERDRAIAHLSAVIDKQPSGEWGRRSQEYRKLLQ